MKIRVLQPVGKKAEPYDVLCVDLLNRINRIIPIEWIEIKSKSLARDSSTRKAQLESEAIAKAISAQEFVIFCDEAGTRFVDSMDFSHRLVSWITMNKTVTFVLGGPYGVSPALEKRANQKISLSPLTLNHHLARLVLAEQIYRGLSIWKNLPYHNA